MHSCRRYKATGTPTEESRDSLTRVTFGARSDESPAWSRDVERLVCLFAGTDVRRVDSAGRALRVRPVAVRSAGRGQDARRATDGNCGADPRSSEPANCRPISVTVRRLRWFASIRHIRIREPGKTHARGALQAMSCASLSARVHDCNEIVGWQETFRRCDIPGLRGASAARGVLARPAGICESAQESIEKNNHDGMLGAGRVRLCATWLRLPQSFRRAEVSR